MNETVPARITERVFVQALSVKSSPLNSSDLRRHQCFHAPKILETIACPKAEQLLVANDSFKIPKSLIAVCRRVQTGQRQGSIERVFCHLDERLRSPVEFLDSICRRDRRIVILCMKISLQFSNPIPESGGHQLGVV